MYTINGMSLKFNYVAIMIHHRSPLPTFMETRFMLLLEEHTLLQTQNRVIAPRHNDHSSFLTTLTINYPSLASNS